MWRGDRSAPSELRIAAKQALTGMPFRHSRLKPALPAPLAAVFSQFFPD